VTDKGSQDNGKVPQLAEAADGTRQSLIEAGLRLFGTKGFDAASIREIAREAGANVAAIGYHFGGKDGLRRACAEQVASTIRSFTTAAFEGPEAIASMSPREARSRLHEFFGRAVPFVLTDRRARLMMHFMIREMANPSIAFDIVYGGVVEPAHRRICLLWGAVTGEDPESEAVRLAVFSIIAQVFYFRFGQEIVLRRMAWKEYGKAEAATIAGIVLATLDSALDRHSADAAGGGR
jgi:AcrR family transcriptional regulator